MLGGAQHWTKLAWDFNHSPPLATCVESVDMGVDTAAGLANMSSRPYLLPRHMQPQWVSHDFNGSHD
jgi:hypothetical protein